MSDLEQAKDKAIAPVTSVFSQLATGNILLASCQEELGNTPLHHVNVAKSINHRSKVMVAR